MKKKEALTKFSARALVPMLRNQGKVGIKIPSCREEYQKLEEELARARRYVNFEERQEGDILILEYRLK